MKTKLQILEETYNYYSNPSNRATDGNGNCFYHTKDGRQCAIGRCLINPKSMANCSLTVKGFDDSTITLERRLKKEYRGHSKYFWKDLQQWHDFNTYFTETGVSTSGEVEYKRLLKIYDN